MLLKASKTNFECSVERRHGPRTSSTSTVDVSVRGSRSSYQANCSRMKGKGKSQLCHALRLWCGNAPCTKKEILNGFINLRCTLGNIFKGRWFQKPAGSLEMH